MEENNFDIFAKEHEIHKVAVREDYIKDRTGKRYLFRVTLSKKKPTKRMTIKILRESWQDTTIPTYQEILHTLQTKTETYKEFLKSKGLKDNSYSKKYYKLAVKEYRKVVRFFTYKELKQLNTIKYENTVIHS